MKKFIELIRWVVATLRARAHSLCSGQALEGEAFRLRSAKISGATTILVGIVIFFLFQPSASALTWTQATANAEWIARSEHASIVTSDGRIWVIGALETGNVHRNDVWYTGAIGVELVDFSATERDGFIKLLPSPFKKETRIEYRVSGIKDSRVSLKIYDISGELVEHRKERINLQTD